MNVPAGGAATGRPREKGNKVSRGAGASENQARRARFRLLEKARKATPWEPTDRMVDGERRTDLPAIRKCRRVRVASEVALRQRQDGGSFFTGLATCDSVWECPCCAAGVKAKRAAEITQVVNYWTAQGGGVYMATFTVRHGWNDRLAPTIEGLMRAWKKFQQGRAWKAWKEEHGAESVRALEMTHGSNGWHPHLHVLFFLKKKVHDDLDDWGDKHAQHEDWFAARWARCVSAELGGAFEPDRAHGVDFRPCKKADYISKLGLEVTDAAASKTGKGRTPFQLLDTALDSDADLALWREYVRGMKGRRFLGWSKGLRRLRDKAAENEKLRSQLEDECARTVEVLSAREWDACRDYPGFSAAVLDAAQAGSPRVLELLRIVKSKIPDYSYRSRVH